VETAPFRELKSIIEIGEIKTLLPGDLRDGIEINGVRVNILHPDPDGQPLILEKDGKWLNNNSLVLKIAYRGKTFLFPGDLEKPGEEVLVSNAGDMVKSDILLSPHHGSKTSSSNEFLEMVQPGICIILQGKGAQAISLIKQCLTDCASWGAGLSGYPDQGPWK